MGVAVADELGLMAHPRPFLEGSDPGQLVERLVALAREEDIGVFVVGLPRTLDGREGPPARRARRFAERLHQRSKCPVVLLDERLTTREAHERLTASGLDARQRRTRVDSASAALLLQAYLDHRRTR